MSDDPAGRPSSKTPTGRAIMLLLDLLGRRWALRVLWELRQGPLTSRALREACDGVSPTVLQARLSELRAADLVEHVHAQGYQVTELGREMLMSFMPLYGFAERWEKRSKSQAQPGDGPG
jgi:DNA-binding HxlR family transcriptional regulator